MKKAFKIIGSSVLVIFLLLITIPFLYQKQINETVKTYLNDSVNAQIEFEAVNLSLLSSFPQANVTVENLNIINNAPFEGASLASVKSISFDMSVTELFKSENDGPMVVTSIAVESAVITIKSNELGNTNYDIAKETETSSSETQAADFALNIENYSIQNSTLIYEDEATLTVVEFSEFNHSGQGNFSTDFSELNTTTETLVSFSIDSTNYMNSVSIKLDALMDLDLIENKYTFKDNIALINQLPLEFNGFFKLLDDGQELDISFKNTGSSFVDFLAVLPETSSKDMEGVITPGGFKVDGKLTGMVTETTIPKLDIQIVSNNASFKYPGLPKTVEAISIHTSIKNDTGNPDDTSINIKNLQFQIDQDVFKASATLKNLSKNMLVDAIIDGRLNLAKISKAYPVELDTELSGLLEGSLHTTFDMNAIETNAYERTTNRGTIVITDLIFDSEDVATPITISKVDIRFKPSIVTLESFAATAGKSDIAATGTIHNFMGFLLSDKTLQGDFKLNLNTFSVSDFMVEDTSESTKNEPTESLKIPAFLDCTLMADAKTVYYDNLILEDVKGTVVLKDEKATLKNMSSRIFDGGLTINGTVDTQPVTPTFDMDLGIDGFNISESFNSLELLQNIAPIAKALQGKLNSTFKISGDLTSDLTPNLNSITGDAFAELLTTKVEPKNAAVFDQLKGALSFVDFEKLDLKDLKTKLNFENGTVNVSPFDVSYEDISISVAGSHGFDKTMNYNAVFDVPAKYFGDEVNSLISKIGDAKAVENLTVPVTATIGGSYTSPNVSTDLTSGVSNLTNQLIEIQKQKLITKGKDQLTDAIGGLLGGTSKDSTQTNNPVKDVLGGLLGGKTKKTDSTSIDTKNPVKDILGGFLGRKKKE